MEKDKDKLTKIEKSRNDDFKPTTENRDISTYERTKTREEHLGYRPDRDKQEKDELPPTETGTAE